jgi:hypothetical protein
MNHMCNLTSCCSVSLSSIDLHLTIAKLTTTNINCPLTVPTLNVRLENACWYSRFNIVEDFIVLP